MVKSRTPGRHRRQPESPIDRPIEPKPHRQSPRWVAAMAAIVATMAMTFAVAGGQGQARAAGLDPGSGSGAGLADIVNSIANGVLQPVADQWRIDMCASGATGPGGKADCSMSTNVGIAMVVPGTIELVPKVPYDIAQALLHLPDAPVAEGSARVIGDGVKFALASTGGKATAIAFLPISLATAGASGGRTSVAFAIVGVANAWNTDEIGTSLLGDTSPLGIPLVSIPAIKRLDCYGVVAAAYAEGVGACGNLLGTLDGRIVQTNDSPLPQLQLGLTDPTSVLTDPATILTGVLQSLLASPSNDLIPFTLSKDFGRLTLGGKDLLAFTSDYGFSGPVSVGWLGQKLTFLDKTTHINGKDRINYLGLPTFTPGTPTGIGDLIPSVTTSGPFSLPFLGNVDVPTLPSLPSGTSTTNTLLAKSSTTSTSKQVAKTTTNTLSAQNTDATDSTATTTGNTPPASGDKSPKSGSGVSTWLSKQHQKFGGSNGDSSTKRKPFSFPKHGQTKQGGNNSGSGSTNNGGTESGSDNGGSESGSSNSGSDSSGADSNGGESGGSTSAGSGPTGSGASKGGSSGGSTGGSTK